MRLLQNKPNLHKRINALFIFSASTYAMTLLGLIPSDQVHGVIANVVNFMAAHNVMYICAFIAFVVSLIQNTQHVFDVTGKLDWLRILGRFGVEMTIMLGGTLASLFAFLALFTSRLDIIITIIIFVATFFVLNVIRPRIINSYDRFITKLPSRSDSK